MAVLRQDDARMKSSRISKATRREWLNRIGAAAAAAGTAGAEAAIRPLQPRRRPASIPPELRQVMNEASSRRPQTAEQWKKFAGDISSRRWPATIDNAMDALPDALHPETPANLALQYIQGLGASVYRQLVQKKPDEPMERSMRSRKLSKATRRQFAARVGTAIAAVGSAGGAALLTRTTPVGPSKPVSAQTTPEPEVETPAIMKTRPLSGIEYSFPVPEGKWRTTAPLHEKHLHGPDSPIHDAIWHASAATGIDPALLTAFHATETQGHEMDKAGNYEKPHYGVEKSLLGKPHVGQDFDRRGNKYDHTFGPFQLSREAFIDAWQGKPPKELDKYGGDIHMALLHDPYIAAMTAAKYITHIRNNYASYKNGMLQQSPLKAVITAALYNRGVGFAKDYKGLVSYDKWLKDGIHGEYGPRLLYNYKQLGGTYESLGDAIYLNPTQKEPEMKPMEQVSRSFRPTPFPHAIWPHEAGLMKASRREIFGMGGEKPPAGEISAPKSAPAPEQPSLLSRVMDKFKLRRRTALQTGVTAATNPSVAVGGVANMAAQAALPAVGAAAALSKEALTHLVGRLQSAPSAGTWLTMDGNAADSGGLPLVRDAKTGLIGMLVHGAGRIVGHRDGIGNSPQGTARARTLYDAYIKGTEMSYGKGPIPEWIRSPIIRRIASMYGAGGISQITGSKYFEDLMQAYKNSGPRGGVSDVVKQALPAGAHDGYGVYVLPAELQSRHAGKPLSHVDGPCVSSGAFELEPIAGEAEQYKRIHEAISKHRMENPQEDVPGWGREHLESMIRMQTKHLDDDHDFSIRMLKELRDAKASGKPLSPEQQEHYDMMREQGWFPEEIDPKQKDLLSHISTAQKNNIEQLEDAVPLDHAQQTIKEYDRREARAELEADAERARIKREAAQKKQERAKAEYSRSSQQRKWKTANLAERAERGQTGANLYLPYERSFRNADLNRLEKALKQSLRKAPTESGLPPAQHGALMRRFFPNEAPASSSSSAPATPEILEETHSGMSAEQRAQLISADRTSMTNLLDNYRAARPRQSADEEGTPMRSISLSSQPFLRVKTNLIDGELAPQSARATALQNEEYKRDHKRIAAEHVKRGTLTDGSVFLNLAGLARHQADLIAKEYVKWHKSGGGPRPDLSKYENPVARRKDGTPWDYREAFQRMRDLDNRATQYDYKHGVYLWHTIFDPHRIWKHIHDNVTDGEDNPLAIYPRELERSGLSPHQYMVGVKDLMNLGLHHQRMSHLLSEEASHV